MSVYDVNGNVISMSDPDAIQPYFEDELAATVASVREAQSEPCLTFAVCTDIHYASTDITTFPHTCKNIKAVSKQVRLDGLLCLGDMTDGDQAKTTTAARIDTCMKMMQDTGLPIYFSAGNHDCNAYGGSANVYTTKQMYGTYYSYSNNETPFDDGSYGVNFYKDFDNYKIRMISLDSSKSDDGSAYHYYYPMNTVTWFVNTAMGTLPEGYSVVLISHVSPIANHNWKDTCPTNNASVEAALRSFVTGGGNVICIMGHGHVDYSFSDPWLDIALSCNKVYRTEDKTIGPGDEAWQLPMGAKVWGRTRGTVTEDTWDVIVIKPASKTVNAIRFGAGEDRTYSYGGTT